MPSTLTSYAGAHAKLAVAARVKGKNPRAFAGTDLIAGLRAVQAPSGRFSDRSQFGDFSNAFTQSYALFALGRDARGASYLAASQCADGGFPVTFETSPCVSDVDATAIVVQALRSQGKPTGTALTWLRSKQQADGGFPSALGGSNANSTGLVAQVVRGNAAVKAQAVLGLTGANLVTLRGGGPDGAPTPHC